MEIQNMPLVNLQTKNFQAFTAIALIAAEILNNDLQRLIAFGFFEVRVTELSFLQYETQWAATCVNNFVKWAAFSINRDNP